MTSDIERREALRIYAGMRPGLADIRERAVLACAASPLHWLAVHGVPLTSYLKHIDDLDALCVSRGG